MEINKSSIAQDLRLLGDILHRNEICADVEPIKKASVDLQRSDNSKPQHSLRGLSFIIGENKNDKIHQVKPRNAYPLMISLSIENLYYGRHGKEFSITDFAIDEFNIIIKSEPLSNICTWHLDKDVGKPGDPHRLVHPLFHFQFGGRKMEELEDHNLGHVLLTGSPRIGHPPMDAILGIDFILSNFLGDKWTSLNQNPDYRRIIYAAQKRIWKPFMLELAKFWDNSERAKSDAETLWPQLIDPKSKPTPSYSSRERQK